MVMLSAPGISTASVVLRASANDVNLQSGALAGFVVSSNEIVGAQLRTIHNREKKHVRLKKGLTKCLLE